MRICKDCPAETKGPRFQRCEPCRKARNRLTQNALRVLATEKRRQIDCADCGIRFATAHMRTNRCPTCRHERRKRYAREWAARNADTQREYTRKWRAENPERNRQQARKGQRKRYGIVNATGESRTGPCEICSKQGSLCFDHDHATGLFRGWLCHACNKGIGHFRDNPALLLKAAQYLANSTQTTPMAPAGAPPPPALPPGGAPPQIAA